MPPSRFDWCVLGAGPAGYAAAVRAHDLGKKILLVERERIGGAGIPNWTGSPTEEAEGTSGGRRTGEKARRGG